MHARILTILAVSAFVLTLLFAVAAGAQEETTEATATLGGGGGTQVQQSQQQQVGTQQVTVQAEGCRRPQTEEEVINPTTHDEGFFGVQGGAIRIRYNVTNRTGPDDELFIEVRDEEGEDDELVRRISVDGETNGSRTEKASVDPGRFSFEVDAGDDIEYSVIIEDCRGTEVADDNNNGDSGGNNNGGTGDDNTNTTDTTDTTGVVPAQTDDTTGTTGTDTTDDTTTADTTTDPAATAEDAGDSANREGSFRCESFLHVVKDDDGALRAQYRDGVGDDELVVQRFEQCLEADVLANTVPDRLLPDTGGSSLIPLAGGALLIAGLLAGGRIFRR